jgi:hypothetical protein
MIPLSEPKRQTIAGNGPHKGSTKQEPWVHISPCRESTDPDDKRGARDDGADDWDSFRQCQEEDRSESVVGMRSDIIDDCGKKRGHRFVLT